MFPNVGPDCGGRGAGACWRRRMSYSLIAPEPDALVDAPPPTPATSYSSSGSAACAAGTRSTVRHVGQRTCLPAWESSADNDVRQTWQGKTTMGESCQLPGYQLPVSRTATPLATGFVI